MNYIKKRKKVFLSTKKIEDIYPINFNHPGIQLENKEKGEILFFVINELSETQKTAFILSYIEGLPRQEVADIMKTTLKSVEGLLQRAKNSLQKKLISIYPEGK